MSGAAMPSLSGAVSNTISAVLMFGLFAAFAAGIATAEMKRKQQVVAIAAAVIAVLVVTVAVAALWYHAAWVDYRRQP